MTILKAADVLEAASVCVATPTVVATATAPVDGRDEIVAIANERGKEPSSAFAPSVDEQLMHVQKALDGACRNHRRSIAMACKVAASSQLGTPQWDATASPVTRSAVVQEPRSGGKLLPSQGVPRERIQHAVQRAYTLCTLWEERRRKRNRDNDATAANLDSDAGVDSSRLERDHIEVGVAGSNPPAACSSNDRAPPSFGSPLALLSMRSGDPGMSPFAVHCGPPARNVNKATAVRRRPGVLAGA